MDYECKVCGQSLDQSLFRYRKSGHRVTKCRKCEVAYQRAAYEKDIDKIRDRKRLSMAQARVKDPERFRERARRFHQNNKERVNAKRRGHHVTRLFWTRALKFKGVTAKDLARMWISQRGMCALSGIKLGRSAQVDHKIPRARGGTSDLSNLRWVTAEVNLAKRDLLDDEFIAICKCIAGRNK